MNSLTKISQLLCCIENEKLHSPTILDKMIIKDLIKNMYKRKYWLTCSKTMFLFDLFFLVFLPVVYSNLKEFVPSFSEKTMKGKSKSELKATLKCYSKSSHIEKLIPKLSEEAYQLIKLIYMFLFISFIIRFTTFFI